MLKSNRLDKKFFLFPLNILLIILSQIAFKLSANESSGNLYLDFNLYLLIGYSLLVLQFFVWSLILSNYSLSFAYPMNSTAYIFLPFAALITIGEDIIFQNFLGMCLIFIGLIIVTKNK